MISFRTALDHLLKNAPRMEAESCRLEDACGRVLRQEVTADREFPPFDRAMMDGYALRFAELTTGRTFRVTGSAPAGQPRVSMTEEAATCIEVMTGAPVPEGADCIVPVERVSGAGGGEIVVDAHFAGNAGLFIHRAGSDAAMGERFLQSGMRLGSREIGVAASCGAAVLEVSRLPRITIIPTGDELVAVTAQPAAHQIRQSNGHSIRAALQAAGYSAALQTPLKDDAAVSDLSPAMETSDWLIFTGAVSKGARDFLPEMFARLGCTMVFHGVAQRPGKPAGFWLGPRGQAIMALPGNPVSALTGLHAFVLPALAVGAGELPTAPRFVVPSKPLDGLPEMTLHLPVTLGPDGRAVAAPTGNSGDFIGLLRSDGFVTIPPRGVQCAAYQFTPWR